MRTTATLFEIVKENKKFFRRGLCNLVYTIYSHGFFTDEEYKRIHDYIQLNKPTRESKYFDKEYEYSIFYWESNKWHPRLLWINYQIKLLNKK